MDSSLTLTSSSKLSFILDTADAARGRLVVGLLGAGADRATGSDKPLNLPRLATPTPQVSCVLYPEHSFPTSRHCEQYGRRRSHLVFLLIQAKQSSDAPLAGALLRLFRCGNAGSTHDEEGGHARGNVMLTRKESSGGEVDYSWKIGIVMEHIEQAMCKVDNNRGVSVWM